MSFNRQFTVGEFKFSLEQGDDLSIELFDEYGELVLYFEQSGVQPSWVVTDITGTIGFVEQLATGWSYMRRPNMDMYETGTHEFADAVEFVSRLEIDRYGTA